MIFIADIDWCNLAGSIQYTVILRKLDEISVKQDQQQKSLDEINKKQDMLKECLQAVAAKIYISNSDILKHNPDVKLPDLPLKVPEDVTHLEIRLADPEFLNQMVNFVLSYLYVPRITLTANFYI